MRKLILPIIAVIICGCGVSCNADGKYHYVKSTAYEQVVSPMPAPGSTVDKADMAAMFDWQQKRTSAQCAEAVAQADATFDEFFGDISPFDKPAPAEVKKFFANVASDTDLIVSDVKDVYRRPRPFLEDARLDPCAGRFSGYAYPSGHATISRLFALILSDVVPERRDQFIARANAAALNRVIGGVHHPSDLEAGKLLAASIYADMLKSPDFVSGMDMLRRLVNSHNIASSGKLESAVAR